MNQIKVLLVGSNRDVEHQLLRLAKIGTISTANAIAWTSCLAEDLNHAIARLTDRVIIDVVLLSNLAVSDQPTLAKCSLLAQKILMHPSSPWLQVTGKGRKRVEAIFRCNGVTARKGPLSNTINTRRTSTNRNK